MGKSYLAMLVVAVILAMVTTNGFFIGLTLGLVASLAIGYMSRGGEQEYE